MCDVVAKALSAGVSRRTALGAVLAGSVTAAAAESASAAPDSATGAARPTGWDRRCRNQLVLLGTSGGPPMWPGSDRHGIASAVSVGDRYYIVDAGAGVLRQARDAKLGNWSADTDGPLDALRGIFLTHLHSDHVVDLNNLLTEGLYNGLHRMDGKIDICSCGRSPQTSTTAPSTTANPSQISCSKARTCRSPPSTWPTPTATRIRGCHRSTCSKTTG
jgi:hypothetical protein